MKQVALIVCIKIYMAMCSSVSSSICIKSTRTRLFGGESLLVEQIPRAQSRGHVITLDQGSALIFPTNHRPVLGKRGYYKHTVRHGVSTITAGERYGLGIIFHDSK